MEGNSDRNSMKMLEAEEGGEEDLEVVKRRISSHPLYRVLIEKHVECLQMSMGIMDKSGAYDLKKHHSKTIADAHVLSELDGFMKTYCTALSELRDSMKEPIHESAAFINSMHSQLKELKELTMTHQSHAKTTKYPGQKTDI